MIKLGTCNIYHCDDHDKTIKTRKSAEAVIQRCSVKKVFLEISQNSQEDTCARVSFLIKLRSATLSKKRLWHRCFYLNFAKFLRTPYMQNTSGRLLFLVSLSTYVPANTLISFLISNRFISN